MVVSEKRLQASNPEASRQSALLRGMLIAIFLLGALGTGTELLLLGHTESLWQWVPLLLIMISFVTLIFLGIFRRAAVVRVLQVVMLLFLASGFVGIWQHYRAKAEFKSEMNPALSGGELFWESIIGATVPPVLAPGMMIQMGLLGLAYSHRHPALIGSRSANGSIHEGK